MTITLTPAVTQPAVAAEKSSETPLLRVENLVKHFPITRGVIFQKRVGAVRAVDGISFAIQHGETLGLVGESGCGKSTTGRAILQIHRPTSGRVYFENHDLTCMKGRDMQKMRRKIQMIFQDPYASLNPRLTVRETIAEPLEIFAVARGRELDETVENLLARVGLDPAFANRYPHEFSGGQRQRIDTARALALQPDLIICDEPISAFDVSIQAQVVNLLEDLQNELGLAYLFIAHDLSMVRHISRRVAVMYLGKIIELADRDTLYSDPRHPYTQALLSAVPIPDPRVEKKRTRVILQGDVPSPANPPSGCYFRTRCNFVKEICKEAQPEMHEVSPGHHAACHLL